jgi:hypothetical protein
MKSSQGINVSKHITMILAENDALDNSTICSVSPVNNLTPSLVATSLDGTEAGSSVVINGGDDDDSILSSSAIYIS